MGTKFAPTHAHIFMGIFEENYIYHLIKEKCKIISKIYGLYISNMERNPR